MHQHWPTLQVAAWDKQLKATVRHTRHPPQQPNATSSAADNAIEPSINQRGNRAEIPPILMQHIPGGADLTLVTDSGDPVVPAERPLRDCLNEEQRRAHDIIEKKLIEHLTTNGKARQLLMLILGQGGTGKSMLIGAITETFEFYGQSEILAKTATTGIAATDIGGVTMHSWAGLSKNLPAKDDWLQTSAAPTVAKRCRNIEGKAFLVLDESSMADKGSVFMMSQVVGHTRGKENLGSAEEPFGGMHVILAGDFHQFPPVKKTNGALYIESETENVKSRLGREIFKQFETVVILDQQIRVKDRIWMEILNRLRVGECDYNDIEEIEKLVLEHDECDIPNFDESPWDEAILVTPRHTVREMWNDEAVLKHCRRTGNIRYVVTAEDVVKKNGWKPSIAQRCKLVQMKEDLTKKLVEKIDIAIGMKVMIKTNIATEADIANGTRGVIHDIILDEREGVVPIVENGTATLKYPPAMILIKPNKQTNLVFDGIERGLIPLTPSVASIAVRLDGEEKPTTILRRQYPITAGYAFTDYKSQGQTIEYVIIDIAAPPTGSISPFGAYVALSRSRGRDTIRLLRKFDRKLFQHHPSEDLRRDMVRLEELNRRTKIWWQEEQARSQ